MTRLLARPDFRRLFIGLVSSMVGDSIMLIVLGIWVKELTGSNAKAGLTILFVVAPTLVAPLLGWVVDRIRRKPFLVWANVASAVALIPLAFVRDASDVWLVYVVAVLYGISFVVIPAALNGLLKEMLADDELVDANGTLQTVRESLRLFGPIAGAGLLSVAGGAAVAGVDAASFLLSAACIATVPVKEDAPAPPELHLLGEVSVGVRHVWRDALLRPTVLSLGLVLLAIGFLETLVFAVVEAFDRPPSFVGVVLTVQGVGAVAGGLLAARFVRRFGEVTTIILSLAGTAVGLSFGAAPALLLVLFGVVIFGFALPPLMVAFTTLMQRRTPARIMGRVSTAIDVVLGGPQTISIGLGAALVGIVDYRLMFVTIAVVALLAAGTLWATFHRLPREALASPAPAEPGTEAPSATAVERPTPAPVAVDPPPEAAASAAGLPA